MRGPKRYGAIEATEAIVDTPCLRFCSILFRMMTTLCVHED